MTASNKTDQKSFPQKEDHQEELECGNAVTREAGC